MLNSKMKKDITLKYQGYVFFYKNFYTVVLGFGKSRRYLCIERMIVMKKLLMAFMLGFMLCLQSGVSMAADDDFAKIEITKVEELGLSITTVDMPLEKGFESIYGQPYAPRTILIDGDDKSMMVMDTPFAAELTLKQYDYVKEQMTKEYGKPDEIKEFAGGTVTVWYPEKDNELAFALNPKSITLLRQKDVMEVLKNHNSSMQLADFVNYIQNLPQEA